MIRVRPPVPRPGRAEAPEGVVDLGARLLEGELRGGVLAGPAREMLRDRLQDAIEHRQYPLAGRLLEAWIDSWAAAALVDEAAARWRAGADGRALAVLGRAAEILRLAHGWGRLGAGPWPLPDRAWLDAALGEAGAARAVTGAGTWDGAEALAAALGVELDRAPDPRVLEVPGREVARRRAGIGRALARGEALAVFFSGPIPDGPEARLAVGEARMEARRQEAFDRYGLPGLLVEEAPTWREVLGPAPAGREGPVLAATCETALLPGTPARLARGDLDTVGWLLFAGPHPAVAVHPAAVHLLRALDGTAELDAVAGRLGAPPAEVREVARQLVALGAATAV